MAKTKAESVMARAVVFYDEKGHYTAAGDWFPYHKTKPSNDTLLAQSDSIGADDLPHACIVDIKLPIPGPLVGKVVKVKAMR